ncbi:MAG: Calx-beta domain-containing protein [Cyanobium sp.]
MALFSGDLLWSQNLLLAQDNKDNFLYENVKTAPSSISAPRFRARFKDILFSATWSTNIPYAAIPGSTFGGLNSVAPYLPAINDTSIRTLDSTEKGLLIHTSSSGVWAPTNVANFVGASTFANTLGNASFGNLSLRYLVAEDTFRGFTSNLGRMSRNPFSDAKVTLVWTGLPNATSTSANLDLYLRGTTTGNVYNAVNAPIKFIGTDATTSTADLIVGAGAIEYIEQFYLPAFFSPLDTSFDVYVNGTLGSVPVATGQDFSIFMTARPVVGQGHGWGDVHLYTFDGKPYDLQEIGDFILVESTRDEFEVQTRQKPWFTYPVSVNTAVSFRIDGKTFIYDSELAIGDEIRVDGVTLNLASGNSAFLGNTKIYRSGNQYTFTYAGLDGNFATADDNDVVIASDNGSYIDVFVNPADDRAGSLQGLLGNGDGDVSNDFALRDGTDLGANPSAATIHTTFADSWRVKSGESLFQIGLAAILIAPIDDVVIQPVPDPQPKPFPKELTSLETLARENPDAVAQAFALAREFDIPEGAFLNGAVFDFLMTGDKLFLNGAKVAAQITAENTGFEDLRAGVSIPLASIEGSKWNDLNANGIWDLGEKGMGGWTIYIDSVNNGVLDPWELSTVTADDGSYRFTGLGMGEYIVREVLKPGWIQTSPTIPHAITLKAGEAATKVDFGNVEVPTISINPRSQIIVEGLTAPQNASYAVTLSRASTGRVTVSYATSNGTALAASDYTATAGTLTFNPGVTSLAINVPIINNTINESDETFSLSLSSPVNALLDTQPTVTTTITDTLSAAATTTLQANVENLLLTGTAAVNGTGNAGNNVITGNSANNFINASGGNDTIDGGLGGDTLTGGVGNDIYVFKFTESTVASFDRITDFAIGPDKIDLLSSSGGQLAAPAAFSRAADSTALNLSAVVAAVFADANGALVGNQALAVNSAALVKVNTASIAGTYIIINDHIADFQASNDLVVNITGFSGILPALGALTTSSFFV